MATYQELLTSYEKLAGEAKIAREQARESALRSATTEKMLAEADGVITDAEAKVIEFFLSEAEKLSQHQPVVVPVVDPHVVTGTGITAPKKSLWDKIWN